MSLSKGFLRECFGLYSFANLSVILGQGDSMVPTLPENCYLLIQQGEVKEGENFEILGCVVGYLKRSLFNF
ncbi:hypothetical protein [Campylobacter lari]|uniref:hypothetical protein n=1 Tax=Campylobacter lari TaxID=201 RepID=UPI002152A3D1|nr:hypothetical protein [Campylobacter lari]MCR6542397.1 hypothetical protein [Campylobacter lari]